jgi:hypothetical protein
MIFGFVMVERADVTAIKVGSLKCHVIQLNGSSVKVTLKEVNYVP